MSYIDSYKHELIGLFGPLPVYHPLENIKGDESGLYFSCSTEQIVIGGGSGEHPGLVLLNPSAAVAHFLEDEISAVINQDVDIRQYPLVQVAQVWEPIVDNFLKHPSEILHFAGWDVERYHSFYELCKSESLPHPYNDQQNFESWLVCGLGEFIFFALPDLASNLIDQLENPYQYFHHSNYNNILIYPPNMPVYANSGNAWGFNRRNQSR